MTGVLETRPSRRPAPKDLLAWLAFLFILTCSLYRQFVTKPLGLDAYILYLPAISMLLLTVLIAALSRRTKVSLIRLSAAMLISLGGLLPYRLYPVDVKNRQYRLISLNIQSQETELSPAIGRIRELRPDFICLQEVWSRSGLEEIERLLFDYQIVGAASHDYKRQRFNEGTFLAIRSDWTIEKTSLKEESALAVASQAGLALVVVSVHAPRAQTFLPSGLRQTVKEQTAQSVTLKEELREYQFPILLSGDFNAPETGPGLKILRPRFHSAFSQAGMGFGLTFPSYCPLARIDHTLGTEQITFSGYSTKGFGSDHLGLIVDFEVSPMTPEASYVYSLTGFLSHNNEVDSVVP